jgi:hypothetical protein
MLAGRRIGLSSVSHLVSCRKMTIRANGLHPLAYAYMWA